MRKIFFFFFLIILTNLLYSQQRIQQSRHRSWQSLVYRIPADTAEKYIRHDDKFPAWYLTQTPGWVWPADTARYDQLPTGNYLIFSTIGQNLKVSFYSQSGIRIFPINDQHRVQLEIRDSAGSLLPDAGVWVNGKKIKRDTDAGSFIIKDKKPDGKWLRITTPGDTLFMEMSAMDEMTQTSWQQWWTHFRYSRTGRILSWPVQKVKTIFSGYRYGRRSKRSVNTTGPGYMLFSQPKYKPGDTLRLKAYILNKRKKPFRKSLDLYLDYAQRGGRTHKKLARIAPDTPGAFLYEMTLGDSLESDRSYNVIWKEGKKVRYTGSFAIEDYLLDEVAEYEIRSEKQIYTTADTLVFYAGAKDANGLGLMDGRVEFYLLTKQIKQFYPQQVWVPDTLWKTEKVLEADGETKITIPSSALPDADLEIQAVAFFKNSNNEVQQKQTNITFARRQRSVQVSLKEGWLQARYLENGIEKRQKGGLMKGDMDEQAIVFPFRQKIDPFVEDYHFFAEEDSVELADEYYTPDSYSNLSFGYHQEDGLSGFQLANPHRILIHYSLFDGSRIVHRGSDTAAIITWLGKIPAKKIYKVQWYYIWAGREETGQQSIARLDKVLRTDITGASVIYPGKKDSITVTVKDYKGRPAAGVNLTAVSYNSQFQRDINVKEPPYLKKYANRRRILFDKYELEDAEFTRSTSLGEHPAARRLFHLDTMLYYQLLFPQDSFVMASQRVADFLPQLSVHVVKKGVPQQVYMLYINRSLAWYHGTTVQMPYAFSTDRGYTQIGFRLQDKFVEIDSIYLQPFYKYDIVFDEEALPQKAKVTEREKYYTNWERLELENSLMHIPRDYRHGDSWLWQQNRVAYVAGDREHLAGPFRIIDSIQYFKPGGFDIKVAYESGFEYRFSPKVVRLERRPIFPQKEKVPLPLLNATWRLGDTLVPPPLIDYTPKISSVQRPFLDTDRRYYSTYQQTGFGRIQINLPYDSSYLYTILYSELADTVIARVLQGAERNMGTVIPGTYSLIYVTAGYHIREINGVEVKAGGIACADMTKIDFAANSKRIQQLQKWQEQQRRKTLEPFVPTAMPAPVRQEPLQVLVKGNGVITGKVTDKEGKLPVGYATVAIEGYKKTAVANETGNFILSELPEGRYVISISAVGYESAKRLVALKNGQQAELQVELLAYSGNLDEVVVIGYGASKKMSMTGSVSKISSLEISSALSGRVAGVQVQGRPGTTATIRIRGISSLPAGSKPLYVIDGIPVDELPADMDLEKMQVALLKDAAATSLYGSRGADGVILITTPGFLASGIRETFRDYAFWRPNLVTDKKGQVRFEVTYPDNITSWQTFVVGMDKKRRITKSSVLVKSYKPLLAQLSTPLFLTEGDSAIVIGKLFNYTASPANVKWSFSINKKYTTEDEQQVVSPNGSNIHHLPVQVAGNDTLALQYQLVDENGFRDGELRRIPVVRKGVQERIGQFWSLLRDTTINYIPDASAGAIEVYAQNNTLDVFLEELKELEGYPFFCMEQTASKLKGLLLERRIRQYLGQPFKKEKMIRQLLKRLQEGQSMDGGWSWWGSASSNLEITAYVIEVLQWLKEDALVQSNIRNAVLYMQNNLPQAGRYNLPTILLALSNAGHEMDYAAHIRKLVFDSVSLHDQWQLIKLRQQQKLPYDKELAQVMKKQRHSMTGGLYWGEDSYRWYSNRVATTLLAYQVWSRDAGGENICHAISRYFLEQRRDGRWRNTVEAATIVAALLPKLLQEQPSFHAASVLSVNGTALNEANGWRMKIEAAEPLQIEKRGGGLIYLTASQTKFNERPAAVTDRFVIRTAFEKSGTAVTELTAGESAVMKVVVDVKADAEYVMIEVPIPAGCTYAEKKMQHWNVHKEYLKNKLVFFAEKMKAGRYEYQISLEPRYSGRYQLNPAVASLMYFPVFYGRNEGREIMINN